MKWNRKANTFQVKIHYVNDGKGDRINIPQPILEKLGYPKYLTFKKTSTMITIEGSQRKTSTQKGSVAK